MKNYSNTGQAVYSKIKKKIIDLTLKPGDKISEQMISEQFRVSRTPAREALVRLSKENLVAAVPYKGTFVSKIDLKNVESTIFIRCALEEKVLIEFMQTATEREFYKIDCVLEDQKKYIKQKSAKHFFELDDEFHRIFYTSTGRKDIYDILQEVSTAYNRIRYLTVEYGIESLSVQALVQEHIGIVDALKQKNIKRAAEILSVHLHHLPNQKDPIIKSFGDGFFVKN